MFELHETSKQTALTFHKFHELSGDWKYGVK